MNLKNINMVKLENEMKYFATLIMLLLLQQLSRFSRVQLCATPQMAAHQAPPSLGPGKNTGVGCHFLLQCKKVKSESEVAQSCLTLSNSMDCSLPGSSVHGIFQAKVLEWVAIAFSTPIIVSIKITQDLTVIHGIRGCSKLLRQGTEEQECPTFF